VLKLRSLCGFQLILGVDFTWSGEFKVAVMSQMKFTEVLGVFRDGRMGLDYGVWSLINWSTIGFSVKSNT